MVTYRDVVDAWDQADPRCIHPSRDESEESYWASGHEQAGKLTTAFRAAGLHEGTVLDYGCGDGRVAIPMAAAGWRMVGADTSLRMLAGLRQNAADTVEAASVDQLPQVDAAYCLAVLIHHDYGSVQQIVAGIGAAVRPGGLLVLDWPTADRPTERRDWIDVTTWGEMEREETARGLGLRLVPSGAPWPVYRRVSP